MRDFAQELWSMSLLLQGIAVIRRANNGYFIRDYFPVLSLALRCDQRSSHRYGSARDQSLHCRIVRQTVPGDDLQIPQAGAIVEFDKRKILGVTTRSHPALHHYRCEWRSSIQCIFDRSRRQHCGRWTKQRTHSSTGDAHDSACPFKKTLQRWSGVFEDGMTFRYQPSCRSQARHPQSAL